MVYPFDSLAIITPIVFIVLLIAFPVIGVFAGWKRAAYWGGGNFVFYIIGMVVWKLAGGAIATAVMPIVQKMLPSDVQTADISQLINSVIAPAFFIIVMLLANIILVICYYTFAKRLMKIGKYSKPQANKKEANKKDTKKVAAKAETKQVAVRTQTKTGVQNKRWFNMVVGGVGMFVLMLPITFTTTHAVALTTTNSTTRKSNSAASNIYNTLQGVSGNMSWFSYYNGQNTGKDYDALFSLITLNNKKITYTDLNGNPVYNASPVDALTNTVSNGMKDVMEKTKDVTDISSYKNAEALGKPINSLSASWDSIMEQCGDDVSTMFNSTGITSVVKTMIGKQDKTIKIDHKTIEEQFKNPDSVYSRMVEAYTTPDSDGKYKIKSDDGSYYEITPIKNIIETSEDAFNDIVQSVYSMYDVSGLSEADQKDLKEITASQVSMLVRIKE